MSQYITPIGAEDAIIPKTHKKPKPHILIGTKVLVKNEVYSNYINKEKFLFKDQINKEATIVGGTYIQTGKYKDGGRIYSYDGIPDDYPPYLDVKNTYFVYLVRLRFTGREIKVLPEDVSII